jgi:hypothetical protein
MTTWSPCMAPRVLHLATPLALALLWWGVPKLLQEAPHYLTHSLPSPSISLCLSRVWTTRPPRLAPWSSVVPCLRPPFAQISYSITFLSSQCPWRTPFLALLPLQTAATGAAITADYYLRGRLASGHRGARQGHQRVRTRPLDLRHHPTADDEPSSADTDKL